MAAEKQVEAANRLSGSSPPISPHSSLYTHAVHLRWQKPSFVTDFDASAIKGLIRHFLLPQKKNLNSFEIAMISKDIKRGHRESAIWCDPLRRSTFH